MSVHEVLMASRNLTFIVAFLVVPLVIWVRKRRSQ